MAKRPPKNDPHAEREAQKYDNPIPSREYIIELLEQADAPLNRNQLSRLLDLSDYDAAEALRRRLKAMERDGQLMRNRKGAYCLVSKMDLVKGRIQAHRDGFGFVIPDDGSDDFYLNSRQMSQVFDGDIVLCRANGVDQRGRREGTIVEVLEHHTKQLVGRYAFENGSAFVIPDNTRIQHDIFISADHVSDLKPEPGQYVVVEIVTQPQWRARPTGKVIEVMGDHMAAGMEIDVAIRSHDIPHVWPAAVLAEAAQLADEPAEQDKQGRIDLRHLPFVTIDGEDARDFDDAVYCEAKKSGGWRLWVAIADVSHYVQVNSALDKEATLRGTSVYFPERVVPMLPEALSNGLCSLKPEVDRLCMVCEMTISEQGKLTGYSFFEGVMHSHARLTYTKVGAMLDPEHGKHEELCQRYAAVLPHVQQLHGLYHALRKQRQVRGAIDFETVETRIVFGPDRKIADIVPVVRNDAHKLIEECMLSANVAAAKFLEKHDIAALFRVHEGPTEERLNSLREFLGELGLDLPGGDDPSPADYQTVMAQIAGRPDEQVIQTMLLRSLRQAVYQPQNEGHFGLNYPGYAHFTSPIRRYPDLLVHRAIRYIVRSKPDDKTVRSVAGVQALDRKKIYPYDMAALLALGEQTSMAERRADEASRDVVAWLKCEYLMDRVGESFTGVVTAVTNFGLFVELKDVYVEGLVHVSALASDYYRFDQAKQRLIGERTRTTFQLGDELTVKVLRVSLDDKKVDLELVDIAVGSNKRKRAQLTKQAAKSAKPKSAAKKGAKVEPEARKPAKKKGRSKSKSSAQQGLKAASPASKKSASKKAVKKAPNKAKKNRSETPAPAKAEKRTAKSMVKGVMAKVRKRLRKKG
ncbi:ribonuclease R [Dasania sp. GY-MA-18]|uniref:Ribonuclease R n=1 Tax=Dasania phycosphaerae TaxID=2950436 RepID=A0A9J6RNN1_9GAMM|nr:MULTISPECIES: ribonuclease R [Dasania]MCR8923713.1 ribonuclease R [Dasania sp. GY-MA-18]MCZ0866147.1 ribonuclease R [Dasania phycosphaerae]MCZ0869871.1 ribonuclease R [Dasania phycosphaerae]